jgi:[NiFe] hydrogenase diaphorase moiety large subunit
MSDPLGPAVAAICGRHGRDPTRLLDVAREAQEAFRCVPDEAMTLIAAELGIPRVEIESLVSFYSFLSRGPKGRIAIRLCDDIIDRLQGYDRVARVFEQELGISVGETTEDGAFSLDRTACIGMSDQAPAALVNEVVVTELTGSKTRMLVRELRGHMDPQRLIRRFGDGNNAHDLLRSMVNNNIRKRGPIVFTPLHRGEPIWKAVAITPAEVIRAVKTARLRGRGGAGFPTGMKWEFTRAAPGKRRYVVCNADEGEPGTFKDRVLLTEKPDRIFAGMTIAGYAIGAEEGILYLRAEYAYLRPYLEHVLEKRREDGLLGDRICGRRCFAFDIRIQMGAGAYVCGEETALLTSCEGRRGDPRNRPPFPAQRGYLGCPTIVNNVETFACVAKILFDGPGAFCEHGTPQSSGTKLLSVSGDCTRPGVYEVPFGITLRGVLDLAGGTHAAAVQVGGPSGCLVGPADFGREISYEGLSTGGSIMVFGHDRDPLEIVHAFLTFFEDESCGYCTPCRAGTVLLRRGIELVREGRGEPADLERFREMGAMMKAASRCGLGQTAANPVLTSLESFPEAYAGRIAEGPDGTRRSFDLEAAVAESDAIARRARGEEA